MYVIETETDKKLPAQVFMVQESELVEISTEDFFFDWSSQRAYEVYRVSIEGSTIPLGLISVERIPAEYRIHIQLVSVSRENKGVSKQYDRIIGNLFAFIAKEAILDFGALACLSLVPKTALANHYIEKYNMKITGRTLSMEIESILSHIEEYDRNE